MDEIVILNGENFSDKQVEELKDWMQKNSEELSFLRIIYYYECCPREIHPLILSRFPMPEVVWGECPKHRKLCKCQISNPVKFFSPLHDKVYDLKDLLDCHIPESSQKYLILEYKDLAEAIFR